jgi:hypothetical protein
MSCHGVVLNGGSVPTEGSRIQKTRSTCPPFIPVQGNQSPCTPLSNSIQYPITPAESSRIAYIGYRCTTTAQNRIQELLTSPTRYSSETVRTLALEQKTISCSTSPLSLFSSRVPPLVLCPPLPPPPAPPARVCPLTKNQKLS